ncbi:uncharacterized protein LOC117334450 [Pecten maximus]|uniref:uncharacterized protein LOC117334450 n=1 Tax=Pecten maximus TaxID=6579 RepID=UPI00145874E2|nr:uncharacterized protein LOC117334450 [Pecten maximus]
MVYAFMFGFAFQHVYQRHSKFTDDIQEKADVITELVWVIKNLNGISAATMLEILNILKTQLIDELYLIQGIDDQIGADSWSILSLLNKRDTQTDKLSGFGGTRKVVRTVDMDRVPESPIDAALYKELIRCLRTLRALTITSQSQTGMPLYHWLVLEMLGFFSFLGVLLISAQSYQIQLAMCVVTVTSISLLCYAVSDLDSPFHGLLRVDLGVISSAVMEIQTHAHYLNVITHSVK